MMLVNHKAKQYLLIALKVFILTLTFGYIYHKITQNEAIDLKEFSKNIFVWNPRTILSLFFFLSLAAANWVFEILKWKLFVSKIEKISFLTAMKQSLASLTVSLASPNRIGEYGAKAYFFEKEKRRSILVLNFFSSTIQMGVTTIFGIIGFGIVFQKYEVPVSTSKILMSLLVLAVLILLGLVFKKQQLVFKGLTISKVIQTFRGLSISIKGRAICYSIMRYLIFSTLFFSLLHFFEAEISLLEFIPLVFSMYLIASIVPTILFFDVVVKGGAAVWLFSLAGISEIPVLSTVLGMWILNFVIPSIIGGFYLFTYTPQKS